MDSDCTKESRIYVPKKKKRKKRKETIQLLSQDLKGQKRKEMANDKLQWSDSRGVRGPQV